MIVPVMAPFRCFHTHVKTTTIHFSTCVWHKQGLVFFIVLESDIVFFFYSRYHHQKVATKKRENLWICVYA